MSVYVNFYINKTDTTLDVINQSFKTADFYYAVEHNVYTINAVIEQDSIIPERDIGGHIKSKDGDWYWIQTKIRYNTADHLEITKSLERLIPKNRIAQDTDANEEGDRAWFGLDVKSD